MLVLKSGSTQMQMFAWFILSKSDPKSVNQGIFKSYYWGELPKEMLKSGIKTRWLHLWSPDNFIKDQKTANEVIRKLNKEEDPNRVHVIPDVVS